MNHTFKLITLSEEEKLWLSEVYTSQEFDVRKTKVKLYGKVANEFDPGKIDSRVYRYDHLTLIGIWLLDPSSKIFDQVSKVISEIRKLIFETPGIDRVVAMDLAKATDLQEQDVAVALWLISDINGFIGDRSYADGKRGCSVASLPGGNNGYDAYLSYSNLEDMLEKFYISSAPVGNNMRSMLLGKSASFPRSLNSLAGSEVIFGGDDVRSKPNTAFIIMPIDPTKPELQDVLKTIKNVCKNFGIDAIRADEIEHQEQITDVVLQNIRDCEFLIADLSMERPNVYYEIGFAHAIGKRPILIRKKGTPMHFDLSIHNAREFENLTALENKLESYFSEVVGKKSK